MVRVVAVNAGVIVVDGDNFDYYDDIVVVVDDHDGDDDDAGVAVCCGLDLTFNTVPTRFTGPSHFLAAIPHVERWRGWHRQGAIGRFDALRYC